MNTTLIPCCGSPSTKCNWPTLVKASLWFDAFMLTSHVHEAVETQQEEKRTKLTQNCFTIDFIPFYQHSLVCIFVVFNQYCCYQPVPGRVDLIYTREFLKKHLLNSCGPHLTNEVQMTSPWYWCVHCLVGSRWPHF